MTLADIIAADPLGPQHISDMGDYLRLVMETPDGQRSEATSTRDDAGLAYLRGLARGAIVRWADAAGDKARKPDVVAFCRSIGVDDSGTKGDAIKALRAFDDTGNLTKPRRG